MESWLTQSWLACHQTHPDVAKLGPAGFLGSHALTESGREASPAIPLRPPRSWLSPHLTGSLPQPRPPGQIWTCDEAEMPSPRRFPGSNLCRRLVCSWNLGVARSPSLAAWSSFLHLEGASAPPCCSPASPRAPLHDSTSRGRGPSETTLLESPELE